MFYDFLEPNIVKQIQYFLSVKLNETIVMTTISPLMKYEKDLKCPSLKTSLMQLG